MSKPAHKGRPSKRAIAFMTTLPFLVMVGIALSLGADRPKALIICLVTGVMLALIVLAEIYLPKQTDRNSAT